MKQTWIILTLCLFLLALPHTGFADEEAKSGPRPRITLGYVERVLVGQSQLEMEAILSPANSSSELDATNLIFKKNKEGKEEVTFTIRDRQGKEETITTLVENRQRKKATVRLPICIAGIRVRTEITLTDRSKFDQEIRLGRIVLAGRALVDPSSTHTTKPTCP